MADGRGNISSRTGTLVTYKNEPFYILYEGDKFVTLFAKTNLNSAATAQANAPISATKCAFSSSQYWSSSWVSGKELDLNTFSGYALTDVMGKAKSYANSKGAISGRLLTYQEAKLLKTDYADMIYGKGNTAQHYECYWLGTVNASYSKCLMFIHGKETLLSYRIFSDDTTYGVRPVITVYKSQIS